MDFSTTVFSMDWKWWDRSAHSGLELSSERSSIRLLIISRFIEREMGF